MTQEFDYGHARNYVRVALSRTSNGKAKRERQPGERKPSSDGHVKRVDLNTVDDIVQSAFVLWWKGRAKHGDKCTWRIACKFAIGKHRRANCTQDNTALTDDEIELYSENVAHGSVTSVQSKIGAILTDLGKPQLTELCRILATGARKRHAAELLGISEQLLQCRLTELRDILGDASTLQEASDTIPHMPMRPMLPMRGFPIRVATSAPCPISAPVTVNALGQYGLPALPMRAMLVTDTATVAMPLSMTDERGLLQPFAQREHEEYTHTLPEVQIRHVIADIVHVCI